jgi:quercetin dioxygenase-like cupin family protein
MRERNLSANISRLMNPTIILHAYLFLGFALALRADPEKVPYNGDVRVKTLLRSSTNSIGQTIAYPHDAPAEVSILIVTIPSGKQTGWHRHPVPLFGYILSGEVTVQLNNGEKHTFHQGDALAESVNTLHNGVNEGKEPAQLLIFVAGEKNVPFTKKAATDKDGRPLGDFEGTHQSKLTPPANGVDQ